MKKSTIIYIFLMFFLCIALVLGAVAFYYVTTTERTGDSTTNFINWVNV